MASRAGLRGVAGPGSHRPPPSFCSRAGESATRPPSPEVEELNRRRTIALSSGQAPRAEDLGIRMLGLPDRWIARGAITGHVRGDRLLPDRPRPAAMSDQKRRPSIAGDPPSLRRPAPPPSGGPPPARTRSGGNGSGSSRAQGPPASSARAARPRQHVRIEHVPLLARPDPRTDLRPGPTSPCGQHPDCPRAGGSARDAQVGSQFRLGRQGGPGLPVAAQDAPPDLVRRPGRCRRGGIVRDGGPRRCRFAAVTSRPRSSQGMNSLSPKSPGPRCESARPRPSPAPSRRCAGPSLRPTPRRPGFRRS